MNSHSISDRLRRQGTGWKRENANVLVGTRPQVRAGGAVSYAETVLPMKDGLPKLKDFPAELGGSGQTVKEIPITFSPLPPSRAGDDGGLRPPWP